MEIKCEQCGHLINVEKKFCENCGYIPKAYRKRVSKKAIFSLILSITVLIILIPMVPFIIEEGNKPARIADLTLMITTLMTFNLLPILMAIISGHSALKDLRNNYYLSGKGIAILSLVIGYLIFIPSAILVLLLLFTSGN